MDKLLEGQVPSHFFRKNFRYLSFVLTLILTHALRCTLSDIPPDTPISSQAQLQEQLLQILRESKAKDTQNWSLETQNKVFALLHLVNNQQNDTNSSMFNAIFAIAKDKASIEKVLNINHPLVTINQRFSSQKNTLLHWSPLTPTFIISTNPKCYSLLLSLPQIDLEAKNINGQTPLTYISTILLEPQHFHYTVFFAPYPSKFRQLILHGAKIYPETIPAIKRAFDEPLEKIQQIIFGLPDNTAPDDDLLEFLLDREDGVAYLSYAIGQANLALIEAFLDKFTYDNDQIVENVLKQGLEHVNLLIRRTK
ncbi:MAG TPA: hypothetical protein VHA52_12210, partial [Candidatus Babeliaceae bacterium]|nr:hypothetical protein [Candidatus Babeliaceae bacterium]